MSDPGRAQPRPAIPLAGEQAADHDRVRTGDQCLRNIAGEANATIRDQWCAGFLQIEILFLKHHAFRPCRAFIDPFY